MQTITCVFCSLDLKREEMISRGDYFIILKSKNPIIEEHLLLIPIRHIRREIDFNQVEALEYAEMCMVAYMHIWKSFGQEPFVFVNPPQQQSVQHLHKHFIPGIFGILGIENALRQYLSNDSYRE